MKELIVESLEEAMIKLDKMTPDTKRETQCKDIEVTGPLEIVSFMKENDIPDEAYFHCGCNYSLAEDNINLVWEIDVPTTDADKLRFRIRRFTHVAWVSVHASLIENGYKRVGDNSARLREFEGTSVYNMYVNEEFDRLVKYYSLSFIKDVEITLAQSACPTAVLKERI